MNNPFDGSWGVPGNRVMEGIKSGFSVSDAFNQMTMNNLKTQEYWKSLENAELQRQIDKNNLQTVLPLTQAANEALLKVHNIGNVNTVQDYINAKNKLNPLPQGMSYVHGKDNNGRDVLYIQDANGNLTNPQPVFTGVSARNSLIMDNARNLYQLRNTLPAEQQAQAQLYAQQQGRADTLYAKQQQELFKLAMGMMGGYGGRGSRGRSGSSSGGQGSSPDALNMFRGFDRQDASFSREEAQKAALQILGYTEQDGQIYDANGSPVQDSQIRANINNTANTIHTNSANAYKQSGGSLSVDDAVSIGRQQFMGNTQQSFEQALSGNYGVAPIMAAPTPSLALNPDTNPLIAPENAPVVVPKVLPNITTTVQPPVDGVTPRVIPSGGAASSIMWPFSVQDYPVSRNIYE